MPRGWFITFEGGEGTGKSTQIERLAAVLRERSREVEVTREPGGTALAERVRALLLDPAHELDGLTEIFLLEAARHDHVERVIRPALERGAVVLCDRFADSSWVYQGVVRGLGEAEVERLNRLATGGLEPDLTLVLDVPVTVGRARQRADGKGQDRFEREDDAFHERVRDAYATAAGPGVVHLDASPPAGIVQEAAWRQVAAVTAPSARGVS
jgi:dTMP kinase